MPRKNPATSRFFASSTFSRPNIRKNASRTCTRSSSRYPIFASSAAATGLSSSAYARQFSFPSFSA